MGLSLCSRETKPRRFINMPLTWDWHVSEGETDQEDSLTYVDVDTVRSCPVDFTKAPIERSEIERTTGNKRGYSLEDRMKKFHRSSVVNQKAERAAKQHA